MTKKITIQYTRTDEAPLLATYSLLPILKSFLAHANVDFQTVDISLAARILAQFNKELEPKQRVQDGLEILAESVKKSDANIIKLPNISASVVQLNAAIKELQSKGYKIPDYPEVPKTEEEKVAFAKYAKVLGSAVNPVIRDGNSDRRVAPPVKDYAKKNPHDLGSWSKTSKTHISSMKEGDFYGSEKSLIFDQASEIKIELHESSGEITLLKNFFKITAGEVVDTSYMSKKSLISYLENEIADAKKNGLLLSLHLKATMMKVSDPIIFGHAVKTYFKDVFTKYAETFKELGINANNGLSDLYQKIEKLPLNLKSEIEEALKNTYKIQPPLAMVNSDKGITNLHVPSDVIVDASIPAALKSSGQMWGADNKLHDTKALIPDRCYSQMYQTIIEDLKHNGVFDVSKIGSVANVGLMALKAEEYGSHDKTFEIKKSGTVKVTDKTNKVLFETKVEAGDIWRMCQTQFVAIQDWVKLAVTRSKASQTPAVFWLDPERAHDRNLIELVNKELKKIDLKGAEIKILSPSEAMTYSLKRLRSGLDTISVTGNVLRDYLTDLFPILELGTSAKMLSIVPLLAGGGLYETGAGGSAPKHVEQLVQENHLRWDSLGEFLALAVSIEDFSHKNNDPVLKVFADGLNRANGKILEFDRSPSRKAGEIDNRGTHFYLSLYWSEELQLQNQNLKVKETFKPIYEKLKASESTILKELSASAGKKADIGGYYWSDETQLNKVMRPSRTFNSIIDSLTL